MTYQVKIIQYDVSIVFNVKKSITAVHTYEYS